VGRAPTGGDKGAGTINATVYDDNVLLTDPVFENYYGAAVTDPTWARGSRPLFTLADVASVTAPEHRLPWIPTRADFEKERVVGGMVDLALAGSGAAADLHSSSSNRASPPRAGRRGRKYLGAAAPLVVFDTASSIRSCSRSSS
jgi:hypothetical protein